MVAPALRIARSDLPGPYPSARSASGSSAQYSVPGPAMRKVVRGLFICPRARMLGAKRPVEWKN